MSYNSKNMAVRTFAYLLVIVSIINYSIVQGVLPPTRDANDPELTCSGNNEVYSECTCEGTCEEPDLLIDCFGTSGCKPRCICEDGFLRNFEGICVPSSTCFTCGENETFTECDGQRCQTSCVSPDPLPGCSLIGDCRPGCTCKEGYLKDFVLDKCVLKSDCSETFVKTPCNAELENLMNCECPGCENCSTLEQKIMCNNLVCVLGCKGCKDCSSTDCGNSSDDCEVTLDENEVYNNCSPLCSPEKTCAGYMFGYDFGCNASPDDIITCVPRRECKAGYVRDAGTRKCVKPETCCEDPNAEVVSCPNPCLGGTCEVPEFEKCKSQCLLRGCQCKKGYVKNYNGKCVLLEDCPKSEA